MTDERLPTPNLFRGGVCDHTGYLPTTECLKCIALALSRARDEGIEAAAQEAYRAVECSWCNEDEHVPDFVCACTDQRNSIAAAIRALKEDRQR